VDLLEKREVFRLVELLASECGLKNLAPGLGCFIEPPRLWDPEAEGFKILIDAEAFMDTSLEKAEAFLGILGLRSRRTTTRYGPFIEIFKPRHK
jgi:hypothetical protein